MEQVLLVIHIMIAAALIAMVLLQRSDTDGFGLSGGGSNLMSGRATANLMTKTTSVLAGLFIITSLVLSIMASQRNHVSLVDKLDQDQSQTLPAGAATPDSKPADTTTPTPAPADETLKKEEQKPVVPNADAATKPAPKSTTHGKHAPAHATKSDATDGAQE